MKVSIGFAAAVLFLADALILTAAGILPGSSVTVRHGFSSSGPEQTGSAGGIRELNLALRSLVFDPFTSKLYGSNSNSLVQIDPDSGQVLRAFPLGTNVTLLAPGAQNGIWAAIEGEHALRRFDLEQLAPEDPIPLGTVLPIIDLAGSTVEAGTAAFVLPAPPVGAFSRVAIVRNGVILPNTEQFVDNVALLGNVLYLGRSSILIRMGVGPEGVISSGLLADTGQGNGHIEILRPYIYRSQGDVFDTLTAKYIRTLPFGGSVAVSESQSAVYFLSRSVAGMAQIARYEHPSLRLTGFAELPGVELADTSSTLVVTGTNRLAFNTATKVYLLDTDQFFLPADLEVLQSVSATTPFSERVMFDVTIRNKGPGVAIGVSAEDQFSSGIGRISFKGDQLYPAGAVPFEWDIITPSAPVKFSVSVQATQVGAITNRIIASAKNDPNAANNAATVSSLVIGFEAPVSVLNFNPQFLSYDERRQRLFFVENLQLWSLDPVVPKLAGPLAFPANSFSVGALEASPAGGLYAYRTVYPFISEIVRIDPDTLSMESYVPAGQLTDLEVSPADPNVFYLADERGSAVYRNKFALGNYLHRAARARFSADGTKLYTVNPETCDLETYAIDGTGLSLVQTQTTGTCDYFQEAGGLLYFDSGIIFDPVTGRKQTNSLRVAQGTLLVPRANGGIDLVSRTNQLWSVLRIDTNGVQTKHVYLDNLAGTPIQAIAAGANRIAIRTSISGLYLVDLDPSFIQVRIAAKSNNTAALFFDSAPGSRYRIERKDNLAIDSWTAAGAAFTASSHTHEAEIPLGESRGFFRIVRVAE